MAQATCAHLASVIIAVFVERVLALVIIVNGFALMIGCGRRAPISFFCSVALCNIVRCCSF